MAAFKLRPSDINVNFNRGGDRTYSAKTLNGNWNEERNDRFFKDPLETKVMTGSEKMWETTTSAGEERVRSYWESKSGFQPKSNAPTHRPATEIPNHINVGPLEVDNMYSTEQRKTYCNVSEQTAPFSPITSPLTRATDQLEEYRNKWTKSGSKTKARLKSTNEYDLRDFSRENRESNSSS